MFNCDVVVVGASLAGASLALRLERAGLHTALLDCDSFPRRKACGEGLSIIGLGELDQLGIGSAVRALPCVPYRGFKFVEGRGSSRLELFSESSGQSHGIGVQRLLLDDLVIHEHRNAGGMQVLGSPTSLSENADSTFSVRGGDQNFHAPYLVLATGGQSKAPQLLGVPTHEYGDRRCGLRVDILRHKEHRQEEHYVEILLDQDMQVCCTHVTAQRTTLSFMTDQTNSAIFRGSNIQNLVSRAKDELSLEGEICEEPLGASGIGRYERAPRLRNIFVIGDALRQLDPIGGMGMTQALVSARVAGDTLATILRKPQSEAFHAITAYPTLLKRELRRLAGYTQLSYWSLVSRCGRPILGPLKTGSVAREVLLSMHRAPSWTSPSGFISYLLLSTAGLL